MQIIRLRRSILGSMLLVAFAALVIIPLMFLREQMRLVAMGNDQDAELAWIEARNMRVRVEASVARLEAEARDQKPITGDDRLDFSKKMPDLARSNELSDEIAHLRDKPSARAKAKEAARKKDLEAARRARLAGLPRLRTLLPRLRIREDLAKAKRDMMKARLSAPWLR